MKNFEIWYTSSHTPKGFAIVAASTPGEAINSMRDVTVIRCREIPGAVFTIQNLVRMADVLNAELGDDPIFVCSVYVQEYDTLAIVSNVTRVIFDLFQCPDARSLYHATRRQLRRLNYEVNH